tara:strand:+ start:191 stop:535 length:345 start_codon:yes stop_codon:yes gene_type:complete
MHCLSTIKKLHDELPKKHIPSKFTCQQLIRWTVDINGEEFAREIYGRELEDDAGGYAIGKFKQMQRDIIGWMANLDPRNKEILAQSIDNHSDADGNIKPDSPLNWGKVIDKENK